MKLLNFVVSKLHGYIDVNIKFKDGMSIIVGGNGSGKTSALTLLANVLRVNHVEISKTLFESVELTYESIEKKRIVQFMVSIDGAQSKRKMRLYRNAELVAEQSIGKSEIDEWYLSIFNSTVKHEGLLKAFDDSSPIQEQKKKIKAKVDLEAKVTFVKLDRAISAIDSHGGMSFEEPESKKEFLFSNSKKNPVKDPLEVVGMSLPQNM